MLNAEIRAVGSSGVMGRRPLSVASRMTGSPRLVTLLVVLLLLVVGACRDGSDERSADGPVPEVAPTPEPSAEPDPTPRDDTQSGDERQRCSTGDEHSPHRSTFLVGPSGAHAS